jgi:hypothetical protein
MQDRRGGWQGLGLEVLGSSDFDGTNLRRDGVYAVCFGATWCLPTRGFAPKFAGQHRLPGVALAMADITQTSNPLWDVFRIKITPTMIVFRNGLPVGRIDGKLVLGLRGPDLERLGVLLAGLSHPTTAPSAPSGR